MILIKRGWKKYWGLFLHNLSEIAEGILILRDGEYFT